MFLEKSSSKVFAINYLNKIFSLYGSNVSISNYTFLFAGQLALPCSQPSLSL